MVTIQEVFVRPTASQLIAIRPEMAIRFRYNDEERLGVVKRIAQTRDMHKVITLQNLRGFRMFRVEKITELKVVIP